MTGRNRPAPLQLSATEPSEKKRDGRREVLAMALLLLVTCTIYGGRSFASRLILDFVSLSQLDSKYRFLLQSSFYWGYAPFQLIGGWFATRFGSKIAMLVALTGITVGFLGTYALLSMPMDIEMKVVGVAGVRFLDGLSQCLFVPTVYVLYNAYVHPARHSKYRSAMSLGSRISRFVAATLEPWLVHGVFGAVAPVCAILGFFTSAVLVTWACVLPSPSHDPESLANRVNDTPNTVKWKKVKRTRPIALCGKEFWTLILYPASIACALVHFSGNWTLTLVESSSQRWYTDVANISVTKATVYSSSPLLVGFISPFVSVGIQVLLADVLKVKRIWIRRWHSCSALVLTACAAWAITLPDSPNNVNICFGASIVMLFSGALHSAGYQSSYTEIAGAYVELVTHACIYVDCDNKHVCVHAWTMVIARSNHFDWFRVFVLPRQSGILSGFGNSVANMAGFTVPWVIYELETSKFFNHDWTYIYSATVILCGTVSVVYFVFVTDVAPLPEDPSSLADDFNAKKRKTE